MKKVAWIFVIFYLVYLMAMAGYFFIWSKSGIPFSAKGTAADPSLFMSKQQLAESVDYNAWRHFLTFAEIPLDWGIYLFIIIFGLSRRLRQISERLSGYFPVQIAFYFFILSLVTAVIYFPLDFAAHQLSVHYGISIESFPEWLKDQGLNFVVSGLISLIIVTVVFFFIRRSPGRWWIPVWLLSIPFVVFMMYIQPVVIDPLYNHFQSLQDGELKREILQLAANSGIPADNVYEVDMSKDTNAMNAYVNGIGSHLRIVLWDTTVRQLSRPEVLFIMAHEMGHYVMHHIEWGVGLTIAGLLIGLLIAAKVHLWVVRRWGALLNLQHPGDLACVPIVLLLFSILSFAGQPAENAVSRHFERAADAYAIHLTKDKKAAISSFQKISQASLGEINPPPLVKFIQYDHPTMLDRIRYLEHVKPGKQ
ncbi:M48 family peptidase [Sporolactobacillus sp. THM7-4]|nr:M48 family peptidase [Sporolactobacillus sp. THM7-4]